MTVELKQLRHLIVAAEHRSFRRAVASLNIKQSTLSRTIRDVEADLQVKLFERSRAGIRPTAAGGAFIKDVRRVMDEIEGLTEIARAAGRGEVGRLKIGFSTSLSAGNLRATLIDYTRRFPKVDLCIIQGPRDDLFASVDKGTLDLAIVTGDPNGRCGRAMPLWSERIMVALPEDHHLAAKEILSWTDLKGERFLLAQFDLGQDFCDLLMMKLASPGDRPKVIRHDVIGETVMSLVSAGMGISITCDAYLGVGYTGVVYREARDGNGPWRLGYTAHWAEDRINPALDAFLKLLGERYPAPGLV